MLDTSEYYDESTRDFRPGTASRAEPRTHLEVGASSHPGLHRRGNEDNYLAAKLSRSLAVENTSLSSVGGVRNSSAEGHVLIVADGMGGVAGGERASTIAVECLEAFFRDSFRSFLHLGETDEPALFRELKSGVELADHAVMAASNLDPSLAGMGTTVVLAYCIDDRAYLIHVGDSRAYHLHAKKLRQVTNDHTLVQLMINGGLLTREGARVHSRRNVVTNIVGGPESGIYAEPHKITLKDTDIILLCSDGLTEVVDDETIASILTRDLPASDLASELIDAALIRGGPDNVTVVVAKAHHVV